MQSPTPLKYKKLDKDSKPCVLRLTSRYLHNSAQLNLSSNLQSENIVQSLDIDRKMFYIRKL